MIKVRKLVWLPLMLLLWSCDSGRVFDENIELAERQWAVKEQPSFSFEIKDADQSYDLFINVRNSTSYQFHNLYVKHYLYGADQKLINSALHNIYLSNPKTGKLTGTGSGDIRDHRVRFLRNVKFTRPGTYIVKLEQYMRIDPLPEIMAIGLRVAKAEDQQ